MAGCPKLTQEMTGGTVCFKADILSNRGIICSSGIHESTLCCWIGYSNKQLQYALSR